MLARRFALPFVLLIALGIAGGLYAQLWKRQSGGFLADRIAAE